MRKPEIQRFKDFETGDLCYGVRIPELWMVTVRWPRVSLCLWFVRMIFGKPARMRVGGSAQDANGRF